MYYGTSVYGHIAFNGLWGVDSAYTVQRTTLESSTNVNHFISGRVDVPSRSFAFAERIWGRRFSSRLLPVSVASWVSLSGTLFVDVDMVGNWSMSWDTTTNVSTERSWPPNSVLTEGNGRHSLLSDTFQGYVGEVARDGQLNFTTYPMAGVQICLRNPETSSYGLNVLEQEWLGTSSYMNIAAGGTWNASLETSEVRSNLEYANNRISLAGANEHDPAIASGFSTGLQVAAGGSPGDGHGSPPSRDEIFGEKPLVKGIEQVKCSILAYERKCKDHDVCTWCICEEDAWICRDDDSMNQDDGNNDEDDGDIAQDALSLSFVPPIRKDQRKYDVEFSDGTTLSFTARAYPSIGSLFNWPNGQQVTPFLFDYADESDCSNSDVEERPRTPQTAGYAEHILELQTIGRFLESAESGVLPSRTGTTSSKWPSKFFHDNMVKESLPAGLSKVWDRNRKSSRVPLERVYEALGSSSGRENFIMADKEINGVKAKLWKGDDPADSGNFEYAVMDWMIKCNYPVYFTKYMKATIAVFNYLDGNQKVNQRLWAQHDKVRAQPQLVEAYIPGAPGLSRVWEEFFLDFTQAMSKRALHWLESKIEFVREAIAIAARNERLPDNAVDVLNQMAQFERDKTRIKIGRQH